MKILLDECIDWRLSRDITGHEVKTSRQMGWSGLTNGRLLARAAQEFDVLITVDQNLSFQQNLSAHAIAVIVLRARSNRLSALQALIPDLLTALASVSYGTVTYVGSERP